MINPSLARRGVDYPGASPPPPGVKANLNHSYSPDRAANIAVLVICLTTVTILFASRVYVKLRIMPGILAEDVTCVAGFTFATIYATTVAYMLRYGEGYHEWDLSPDDDMHIRKWLYVGSSVYCPAAYFIKATLLLLIARIFSVKERFARAMRIFIWGLAVCYVPMQILKMRACNPIKKYWYPSIEGSCLDMSKIFMADSCLALTTDLIVLIVPIPLTWNLNIPLRKKMRIWALLGAGGAATGMTAYRVYRVLQLIQGTDDSFLFLRVDIMTLLEINIGLTCACIPSFKVLFFNLRKRITPAPNVPRTSIQKQSPFRSDSTMSSWWSRSSKTRDEELVREISLSEIQAEEPLEFPRR